MTGLGKLHHGDEDLDQRQVWAASIDQGRSAGPEVDVGSWSAADYSSVTALESFNAVMEFVVLRG